MLQIEDGTGAEIDTLELSASSVLARVRSAKQSAERAERDVLFACVDWAAIHSTDTLIGPADSWHEQELPLGGEGAPTVAEFAVTELAAALGVSTRAGRAFLADAVELRYRLPRTYARIVAGEVLAWRARRIAQATRPLSPEAARWVDRQVAPYADSVGTTQLDRLVEQALVTFDPDTAEERRLARLPHKQVDIRLGDAATGLNGLNGLNGLDGLVYVDATLDHADAAALEQAVAEIAEQLRQAGSPDTLDERRATALGMLARGETPLPTEPRDDEERESAATVPQPVPQPVRRHVRIFAHLHADATGHLDMTQWAEVTTGNRSTAALVAAEQVAGWCQTSGTTVTITPVIDTRTTLTGNGYNIPPRVQEQIRLRDGVCAFPYCTRTARAADLDHIKPFDPKDPTRGPTSSANLAPLCRSHHRAKTTGGWTYTPINLTNQPSQPGHYLWTSPHGQTFHTHGHQTWDLTDP